MAIVVTCECGKRIRAKDEDAGKRGHCPGCGRTLLVPAPRSSSPADASGEPASIECSCGRSLHVKGMEGKQVKCPACGAKHQVPGPFGTHVARSQLRIEADSAPPTQQLRCKRCGRLLLTTEITAGQTIRCPKCNCLNQVSVITKSRVSQEPRREGLAGLSENDLMPPPRLADEEAATSDQKETCSTHHYAANITSDPFLERWSRKRCKTPIVVKRIIGLILLLAYFRVQFVFYYYLLSANVSGEWLPACQYIAAWATAIIAIIGYMVWSDRDRPTVLLMLLSGIIPGLVYFRALKLIRE